MTSTVAKWHDKRRGLALGIAAAGVGVCSIIFPPAATGLIEAFGWRWAVTLLGLLTLVLAVPGSLVMKDPPIAPTSRGSDVTLKPKDPFQVWNLMGRLLNNRACVAVIVLFVLMYTDSMFLQSHFVNYATDLGASALTAAGMMSAMGIASTLGRLGMGVVSDRIGLGEMRPFGAYCWPCLF